MSKYKPIDLERLSVNSSGMYTTSFHFTYECEEDLFRAGFIIGSIFGIDEGGILNIDKDEKTASITIPYINQKLIEILYDYYDDDIRTLFVGDEILIGLDKQLSSMGL